MIEKMKVVYIVAQASRRAEMLDTLRDLGILHLAEKKDADPALIERFETLTRLSFALKDYMPENGETEILSDEAFESLYQETDATLQRKAELNNTRTAALLAAERQRAWGDFDPEDVIKLRQGGFDFHFYRLDKKSYQTLQAREDIRYIRLAPVEKQETVAVLGTLDETIPAMEFTLPEKSISQWEQEAAACDKELANCDAVLCKAAGCLKSYSDQLLKTKNAAEYSAVNATAESENGLVWLSGYIPEADTSAFVETAKAHNWAYSLQDVDPDDEKVPAKVRYSKISRLIEPVFAILGTVPGYREYDISFWFLAFFTLFFAMIIGDAGYGLLFLLGTVGYTIKKKKTSNATLLLFVLSVATIVWGSITGTWFGLEGAMKVPFLKALVLPGFANYPEYFGLTATVAQNNVMKFCFSIGAIQLALACIMNIRRKLTEKNLSWLADLGWLMSVCSLYFVVLYLVIGQQVNLPIVGAIVGAGFLLVVLFGGMAPGKTFTQGLKAGVGDAFTVFLNTISAFGNVMSYIRLFAVGMASLAIAQSFNNMAAGFKGPLMVAGIAIMVIGHALNIVMGFLSVVVHGVRLNLLEFSGQLGMEWSGTAYDPFRKRNK